MCGAGSRSSGLPSWSSRVSRPTGPTVVVAVNEPARALGLAAGTLVRSAAQTLGGGGGGRDDVAQGGGAPQGDRTGQAIAEAFDAVRAVVRDSA